MFWELSGDKGGAPREGMEDGHGKEAQPGRSLVRVVKEAMGELDAQPTGRCVYGLREPLHCIFAMGCSSLRQHFV
jgi:hypothetical protein